MNTLATTRSQSLAKVLYSNYTPLTQDKMSLFNEKQKCMCSVSYNTLQPGRYKKFVRDHEDDFDAQMVYKKIVDFTQLLWDLKSAHLKC